MNKILLALALLLPATLSAQIAYNGVCAKGNIFAQVSGLHSANSFYGTFPQCTITVYLTGTLTKATLYSDLSSTPLTNPFTGNLDGSFLFFSVAGAYDVVLSGGSPIQIPSPVTLTAVTLGSGGGSTVIGTANQITVNSGKVGLANPLVFPGPVSGSSGAFSTLSGNFCVVGTTSCLVVGVAVTNPCCTTPEGALWVLDPSLHGFGHLTMYDGSGYDTYLTNNDNPCDMAYGCTGVPGLGVGVALANTPIFVTPYIDAATGKSFSFSSTTGNWLSIQQGTVTPFCQSATSAGVIQECFGSDSRMQISEGTGDQAYHDVAQTVASGTASMTTALIASGACGTTVTVSATNAATTDTIVTARNAAATNSNGGQLIMNAWPTSGNVNFNYCNPGAGNVTPGAATINWKVIR